MRTPLSLLLIALMSVGVAHAAMYKWVDEEGNVSYSQNPPPGKKAEVIAPPPPPPDAPAQPAAEGAKDIDPEASPAEQQQQKAAAYARNCKAARENLKIYQLHSTILEGDTTVTLSDEERKRRMDESRKQIDLYCQDAEKKSRRVQQSGDLA